MVIFISRAMLFVLLAAGVARAQGEAPAERYRTPPKEIADLVDAPVTPLVATSPSGKQLLIGEQAGLLTIADLSQPELKLAGMRFNPVTRAPGRATYLKGLLLLDVATGTQREARGLPAGAHLRTPVWAPDEKHVAFTHATTSELQLWVLEVESAQARRLSGVVINNVRARPFHWMPDSRALLCAALPEKPKAAPADSEVPVGPAIQETTSGKKSAGRTFQDLIKSAHDEDLFEHYVTAEIALVQVADGAVKRVTGSELLMAYEPSPDGTSLLVETTHRPFSRIVPVTMFPLKSEVRALDGKSIATVADLPAYENLLPDEDSVRTGRRDISWRADAPATLYWVEAQDDGDPKKEVPAHDHVYTAGAPYLAPQLLAALPLRYRNVEWASDDLALVSEAWWKTRKTRTYRVAPRAPAKELDVVWDRSSEDEYSDPGEPAHRNLPNGQSVMLLANGGKALYLLGEGASPEGNRPFLDRFDLSSKKAERLWRSAAPHFEQPLRVLDETGTAMLTLRESVGEPRNVFHRELARPEPRAVTSFPHPAPQLKEVKKELIRYKRADGVDLSGILYLPPKYTPKKDPPLPVLMWAYPAEFKSASAAGQVRDSPFRFVGPSVQRPVPFTLRGYAVLDNPTFPIVGEGKVEPNDTYVKQLSEGAQAAVDELARRGVGDPQRMAIGGHSYGAFTCANLLAHTDLFRAGIARSGAYNRTLTPFGFQSEERTFWEAADTYVAMSPFSVADRLDEPLLMLHGMEDQNSGTFPMQSERLLHALKGLGGTARLVMLPKEGHGYQARESLMHMWWEMDAWLGTHVMNAGPRKPKPSKK